MKAPSRRSFGFGAVAAIVAMLGMGVSLPANASEQTVRQSSSAEMCIAEEAYTKTVHHDDVFSIKEITVPGTEEVSYLQERWEQVVPDVVEISHDEFMLTRTIEGDTEVTDQRWKYSTVVEGDREISHKERQFSRTNPGQEEVSVVERQFARTNPGQAKISHDEFKYQQSTTEYRFKTRVERPDNTVERKFIQGYDFVDGGTTKVNGKTVSGHWIKSTGWHAIPDTIINIVWGSGGVPPQYLGGSESKPKGNVGLSVYGGPNVNAPYYASLITIDGGYTDWGPWSGWTTTNPGADNSLRQSESRAVVTDYNGGNWTTDTPGAPWVQVDKREAVTQEYIAPFTEFRGQDGSVVLVESNAGWFTESSFEGWSQYGANRTTITQQPIAPFAEYRAQDGTPTTNVNDAGWFPETSFEGWNQYGAAKKVVTQEATADQTLYLTRDSEGNLGTTTVLAESSWFTAADIDGIGDEWVEFAREEFSVSEGTPNVTLYLMLDSEGYLTETEDMALASWINLAEIDVDLDVWSFVANENGDAVVNTVITQEFVAGYTMFYVPGGEPTRELGESNWTTDKPEGWTLVDERLFVEVEGTPPTTTYEKVLEKAAYDEKIFVEAKTKPCPPALAVTGGSLESMTPLLIGGGAALTIGIAVVVLMAMKRHREESELV